MTSLGANSRTVEIVSRELVTPRPTPFVTLTTKEYVPTAVGLPERTPDSESSESPGGNLPPDTTYFDGRADLTTKRYLKGVPTFARGDGDIATKTGGNHVSVRILIAAVLAGRPTPLLASTANMNDPATRGVPDNNPLDDASDIPGGR